MRIIEVNTPHEVQVFLNLPDILYKNDPYWIKPLNKDIEEGGTKLTTFEDPPRDFITRGGADIRVENPHVNGLVRGIN